MSGAIVVTWVDRRAKAAAIRAIIPPAQTTDLLDWGDDVSEAGERALQAAVNRGFGFGGSTKKGGPRVESGSMLASAGGESRITAGMGFAEAGFGVGGTPAPVWTKWQEYGTSRGIAPMLAVPEAIYAMNIRMPEATDEYFNKTKARWEAIG